LAVCVALSVLGCGGAARSGGRANDATGEGASVGAIEVGRASYYADSLAGHRTASGDRYDPDPLTAAHRTLPFGTLVEVTRDDGRSVRVRIADRGPLGDARRIVDLSRRAAAEIGLLRDGVADVTLRVIALPAHKGRSRRADGRARPQP